MIRVESWLHHKTAATVEPNLYSLTMRRCGFVPFATGFTFTSTKLRRFGFPQPLLPLIEPTRATPALGRTPLCFYHSAVVQKSNRATSPALPLSARSSLHTATRGHRRQDVVYLCHIDFLNDLIGTAKWAREIHIALDSLSAHKTKAVEEFLQANPTVRFHSTPTYSSWLNQVEIWFATIQRDVIARGGFTSVSDLARKLRKYIRAEPIRDTSRRMRLVVTK